MASVKVQSLKNQIWIAEECKVAESFFDRLRGLIGTKVLNNGQGLLLSPCKDIHMWWMSIPIDVVFIRPTNSKNKSTSRIIGNYEVSSVRKNLKPWHIFPVRDGRARQTLELPVGTIERCDLREKDQICIS